MTYSDDITLIDITELKGETLLESFDEIDNYNNDDLKSYFNTIDNNFFKNQF